MYKGFDEAIFLFLFLFLLRMNAFLLQKMLLGVFLPNNYADISAGTSSGISEDTKLSRKKKKTFFKKSKILVYFFMNFLKKKIIQFNVWFISLIYKEKSGVDNFGAYKETIVRY